MKRAGLLGPLAFVAGINNNRYSRMARTTAKTRASVSASPSFRVSPRLGLGLLLVLGLELGGGTLIILRQMIFLDHY